MIGQLSWLTPLTRVQLARILALVEARRLDVVPAGPLRGEAGGCRGDRDAEQVARTLFDAALARGLSP